MPLLPASAITSSAESTRTARWFSNGRSDAPGSPARSSTNAPPTSTRPNRRVETVLLVGAGRRLGVGGPQRDVVEVVLDVGRRLDERQPDPFADVEDLRRSLGQRGACTREIRDAKRDMLERARFHEGLRRRRGSACRGDVASHEREVALLVITASRGGARGTGRALPGRRPRARRGQASSAARIATLAIGGGVREVTPGPQGSIPGPSEDQLARAAPRRAGAEAPRERVSPDDRVLLAAVFRPVAFRAAVLRPVVFRAAAFLAVDLRAVDFLAVDFPTTSGRLCCRLRAVDFWPSTYEPSTSWPSTSFGELPPSWRSTSTSRRLLGCRLLGGRLLGGSTLRAVDFFGGRLSSPRLLGGRLFGLSTFLPSTFGRLWPSCEPSSSSCRPTCCGKIPSGAELREPERDE